MRSEKKGTLNKIKNNNNLHNIQFNKSNKVLHKTTKIYYKEISNNVNSICFFQPNFLEQHFYFGYTECSS